jgi:hypothetical protein
MAGGLMQLIAYGAQDVYLTGNPKITFFKVVYKRHTNFSVEAIEQTVQGSSSFGGKINININRQGDLITKMYLKIVLDKVTLSSTYAGTSAAWVRRVGFAAIDNVEFEVGGSKIDRHYGTWLNIWYELTHSGDQERGYNKMIGDVEELTKLKEVPAAGSTIMDEYTLFVPLQFWFCRNPGLALPLIALQYHEAKVSVTFKEVHKLVIWSGATAPDFTAFKIKEVSLLVDFVYLDSIERKRFAQMGHEYLIEQVQHTGIESLAESTGLISTKHKLSFNHPTKELIWGLNIGAFNGENLTTNTSSTSSKFLCYTHDDSKWSDALDYAAQNVANGMVVATYAATLTGEDSTNANILYFDYSAGASVTHKGITIKAYVSFEEEDGSPVTDALSAAGDGTSVVKIGINAKPLYDATYNLGSYIKIIDVTIKVVVAGGKVTALYQPTDSTKHKSVSVLSHTLTLEHASIPISYWTDARATADKALDVTVIQPHNFGVRLDGKGNPIKTALIQLNGHERFNTREGSYFNYVQPHQHHTRTPADGINVYSFALNPEKHQPSGSANLSRIDSTQLVLGISDPYRFGKSVPQLNLCSGSNLYIFGYSINVFRIMSGMGGLAYSN